MIDRIKDDVAALRDRALLMLLSTYGLRSGEVRRLQLDNLHWSEGQLTVARSKSLHVQTLPLEPSVGDVIARYLQYGRPKTTCRVVFLTLRTPHRALSAGGPITSHASNETPDGPDRSVVPTVTNHLV